jgi:hypothetical protein
VIALAWGLPAQSLADGQTVTVAVKSGKYCGPWSFEHLPDSGYKCAPTKFGHRFGDCEVVLPKPSSNNGLWIGGHARVRIDVGEDGALRVFGPSARADGAALQFEVMPNPVKLKTNGYQQLYGFEYHDYSPLCAKKPSEVYLVAGTNTLFTFTRGAAIVSVSADGKSIATSDTRNFSVEGALTLAFSTMRLAVVPEKRIKWGLFQTISSEYPAAATVLTHNQVELWNEVTKESVVFTTNGPCRVEPPGVTLGKTRFDFFVDAAVCGPR